MNNRTRTAQRQDWQTPPDIVDRLHKLFPAGFHDPCTTADNPTGAASYEYPDSVSQGPPSDRPWYMNPPWQATTMPRWLGLFALEARVGGVICVPAATDREWWGPFTEIAPLVVLSRGRVRFVDPDTGQPGPQPPCGTAFGYVGEEPSRFLEVFGDLGTIATFAPLSTAIRVAQFAERVRMHGPTARTATACTATACHRT